MDVLKEFQAAIEIEFAKNLELGVILPIVLGDVKNFFIKIILLSIWLMLQKDLYAFDSTCK